MYEDFKMGSEHDRIIQVRRVALTFLKVKKKKKQKKCEQSATLWEKKHRENGIEILPLKKTNNKKQTLDID